MSSDRPVRQDQRSGDGRTLYIFPCPDFDSRRGTRPSVSWSDRCKQWRRSSAQPVCNWLHYHPWIAEWLLDSLYFCTLVSRLVSEAANEVGAFADLLRCVVWGAGGQSSSVGTGHFVYVLPGLILRNRGTYS